MNDIFQNDPEIKSFLEQRKAIKLAKDSEMQSLRDHASQLESQLFLEILRHMKGEDGEPGADSFIPGPQGNPGHDSVVPGPQGESGYTPIKGVDYFDGVDGESIIGPPGADGESVSVDDVLSAIQSLKGKDAETFARAIGKMIDISYIKNAQSFMFGGKNIKDTRVKFEELLHGGGSSSSTSNGYQVPTGTVNGVNTSFTFTTAPNAMVVDGVSFNKTNSDGTVNWTGTTTIVLSVAPNFNIYGVA